MTIKFDISSLPDLPSLTETLMLQQLSAMMAVPSHVFLDDLYYPEQQQQLMKMIRWVSQHSADNFPIWMERVNKWNRYGMDYDEIMYNLYQSVGSFPPITEFTTAEKDEEGVYFK